MKKIKLIYSGIFPLFLYTLGFVNVVFGQEDGGGETVESGDSMFSNIVEMLGDLLTVLDFLVLVILGLALIYFLWGLSLLILGAGEEEKRKKGKSVMVWGVIALTIMIAIWGIIQFSIDALNINQSTIDTVPRVPTIEE